MQTINPKTRLRGTVGDYFGLDTRTYVSLAKFASQVEKLGFKILAIGPGPFKAGALLKMASPNHDYELLVDGTGRMFLGRVENDGKRSLREGGTNTEAQWEKLLSALKNSERRVSARNAG
jgi:hypothetical protein